MSTIIVVKSTKSSSVFVFALLPKRGYVLNNPDMHLLEYPKMCRTGANESSSVIGDITFIHFVWWKWNTHHRKPTKFRTNKLQYCCWYLITAPVTYTSERVLIIHSIDRSWIYHGSEDVVLSYGWFVEYDFVCVDDSTATTRTTTSSSQHIFQRCLLYHIDITGGNEMDKNFSTVSFW